MRGMAVLVLLAGCGPISVQQAEEQCFDRARLATQPRGEIGFGAGPDGPAGRFELTITSDYIQGRDPSALYDSCVFQKSGQPPSRPLYDRPDWRG